MPRELAKPERLLVGRSEELRLFRSLLQGAVSGSRSVLLLAASSGYGKSTLLERLGTMDSRFDVLTVRCGPSDRALRSLCVRVRSRRLEQDAKQRPLMLLFDDIQLVALEELALLEGLFYGAFEARTLVAATYAQSTDAPPARLADLLVRLIARGAMLRTLSPLSENEAAVLVRNLALSAASPIDARSVREILRVCGGNPRYLTELTEGWHPGQDPAQAVPFSATAGAQALRAILPADAMDVLAAATALGERFREMWLAALTNAADETIAQALQAGSDRGLLYATREHGVYAFADLAVAKALYLSIVPYRRRQLHTRIAEYLTAERGDAADDDLIATHWDAAGETAKAAGYLSASAERFDRSGSPRRAGELFERAASLAGETARLSMLENAATAYERAGDLDDAVPLREAVAHATPRHDAGRYVAACSALLEDYWWVGRRGDALRLLAELRDSQPGAARSVIAKNAVRWASLLCNEGYEGDARAALADVAPGDVPPSQLPRYRLMLAMLRSEMEPVRATMAEVSNAVDAAERVDDATQGTVTLIEAGYFALRLGRLTAAIDFAERAERLTTAIDSPRLRCLATVFKTDLSLFRGDLESARRLLSSLAAIRDMGDLWEINIASLSVFVGIRTNDNMLVSSYFDVQLMRSAAEYGRPATCATLLMGYPEAMVARGMMPELRSFLRACARRRLETYFFTIALALARFGPMDCLETARASIRRWEGRHDVGVAAAAAGHLFDSFVKKRRRDNAGAMRCARAAAALYRKLKWPLYEALAIEHAGDTAKARALYARCGATYDVERLHRQSTRKLSQAFAGARLTPREGEVAELITRGLRDAEIAAKLGVSRRTAEHHVEAILSKLGIRARWQLTTALLKASEPE